MSSSEKQEDEAGLLAAPRTAVFEQEWLLLDPGQEEDDQRARPPLWTWALLVAAVRTRRRRRRRQLAASLLARNFCSCALHRACVSHTTTPPALQVFAVSSAAVVFAMMSEVPAITLAAWRLQLTSVLLGIGATVQLLGMPPEDRRRTAQSVSGRAAHSK